MHDTSLAVDDATHAFEALLPERAGNLEDAAYEGIRKALMEGRLRPGQSFTLRGLAQAFGTSPMPVRDALKRLVAERALQLLPNRSVMLPRMSRARFQEILQVRLSLETMITERAAQRIAPETIEAMGRDHEDMCLAADAGDKAGYLAANRRFHFRLYEAAGSVVMLPFIESLWLQVGPYLNQIFKPGAGRIDTADHHHMEVLRALRRGDGAGAARAIWNDLSSAADGILIDNDFSGDSE
ncbi:GntR family transcriptional regulator [Pigmentiphaga soli]|uniref:GntR family transcriptional regulator n=1 Tax=Pigmentiphaga soli TaxID=1007095 RepID=A0ABP8GWS1_9BURK